MDTEAISANTNVGLTKAEPKPEPQPTPPAVVAPKNITRNIFFGLRSTEVSSAEQPKLAEVATWLKEHPTAKVVVTGYADKGTGTAPVNARYAKMRADSVTKMLTKKYGVAANRITTDSKGDTVQPFPNNNDQNRVTIVIAEE
jgi:outer membrane protein OmpA-like peptidoglycan-associated protein